jgi:hypothetical protein
MPKQKRSSRSKMVLIGAKVPPEFKTAVGEIVRKEHRTESNVGYLLMLRGFAAYKRDGVLVEALSEQITNTPTAQVDKTDAAHETDVGRERHIPVIKAGKKREQERKRA